MQPSSGRGPRGSPVTPPTWPVLHKCLRSGCLANQDAAPCQPSRCLPGYLSLQGSHGLRLQGIRVLDLCCISYSINRLSSPFPMHAHSRLRTHGATCCPPHAIQALSAWSALSSHLPLACLWKSHPPSSTMTPCSRFLNHTCHLAL